MNKELFYKWLHAQEQLQKWKKIEADLRLQLADKIIDNPMFIGTKSDFIDNFKVTVSKKLNYSVNEDELSKIASSLNANEKEAIKLKPILVLSKYKQLPENTMLNRAVMTTPAMPVIKVKEID